ncbi:LytTR family transcriptional regulator DNA-binding domain-containing protein [Tannockella kyphosi]|uniref:LytTR family transcriptional regulator DNA-binding domain-containing protein n=1 Tax=Tannockella kyphosi TaxID=2899121 RepID=UPI002011AF3E|nr:LytTR family transcriptional regulator DNA-binding domain-containing protein [Tannockella kyphosi]
MRVLVYYEEIDIVSQLVKYIKDYDINNDFMIHSQSTKEIFNKSNNEYDIYFIQYSYPLSETKMNLWEKYIHKNKNQVIFVFICDSIGMVENIPSLNPIFFIRKNRMARDLDKLFVFINKFIEKKNHFIKTTFNSQLSKLKFGDVIYIEDYGYETLFNMIDKKVLIFGRIEDIVEELKEATLIPIKKTCFINIDKINYIGSQYIILVNGEVLRVDRQYYDKMIDAYKENLIYGI